MRFASNDNVGDFTRPFRAHARWSDSPARPKRLQDAERLRAPLRSVFPSPCKNSNLTQFCIAAPSTSRLLPAGPAFQSHARRILNQRSFEEDDLIQHEEFIKNGGGLEEVDEDADEGLGEETEARELLLSDPKLWKVSFVAFILSWREKVGPGD